MGRELDRDKSRLAYILIIAGVIYMFYATQINPTGDIPLGRLWVIGVCICGGLALVGIKIDRIPGFGGKDEQAKESKEDTEDDTKPSKIRRGSKGLSGPSSGDSSGNFRLLGY